MKYLFLFLALFCMFKIDTFGRKPAVEPILGVSIEEYKEVPPSKAKGYDFNRKPSSDKVKLPVKNRIHDQKEIKESHHISKNGNKTLLYVVLIFLPIIASGISFYRIRKSNRSKEQERDNVIDLHSSRNEHGDIDKKAS